MELQMKKILMEGVEEQRLVGKLYALSEDVGQLAGSSRI